MKMKDLYSIIDCPVNMIDNDGYEYTYDECKNMEVVSIQPGIDKIYCVVDKFSLFD